MLGRGEDYQRASAWHGSGTASNPVSRTLWKMKMECAPVSAHSEGHGLLACEGAGQAGFLNLSGVENTMF